MDEKLALMRAGQRKRERKVNAKAYMPLYALVLPIQHCSLRAHHRHSLEDKASAQGA